MALHVGRSSVGRCEILLLNVAAKAVDSVWVPAGHTAGSYCLAIRVGYHSLPYTAETLGQVFIGNYNFDMLQPSMSLALLVKNQSLLCHLFFSSQSLSV
jgi:hypothetical protein